MFAVPLSICQKNVHTATGWMGSKKSSWVCSPKVKVSVQSPNSFFIFSNHINSRATVSSSKYSTNTRARDEIRCQCLLTPLPSKE